jgi:drug/metabolite transporter (DMT)-like permease
LLVLLAVVPTVGGYGLYTVSLTHLPASTASLIVTLEPVMTAALAFVFLGERLTVLQTLGGGLILTGVVLLRLSDRVANGAGTPPLNGLRGSRSRSPGSGTGRRAAPGEVPPPSRT